MNIPRSHFSIPVLPQNYQAIGLGDLLKRATAAVGIEPCGGCDQRAERLNELARLEPRGYDPRRFED